MQNREFQKVAEDALFDNRLAQEFLENGKAAELADYLSGSELRLRSGMTAEEIDAVETRAKQAYARLNR
ncbi:MAG: hypothetical protein FWC70_09935 [Defluviitaleaceae bacterium]|nr:hypothetical protein [Defluviitaleaceae bacterium]